MQKLFKNLALAEISQLWYNFEDFFWKMNVKRHAATF
jgi:hypothetical protein